MRSGVKPPKPVMRGTPAGANGRRSSITSVGRYRDDDAQSHASTESEYIKPVIVSIAPRDQEPLPADPKLREEFLNQSRNTDYTAANPNSSKSKCHFVYRDGVYKTDPVIDHLAVHFSMDGVLIHIDSLEAKQQLDAERKAREAFEKDGGASVNAASMAAAAAAAAASGSAPPGADEAGAALGPKVVLRNQFNFSERAAQTVNPPLRNRSTQTEPAPTTDFDGQVTAWEIFDTYLDDVERQVLARAPKEKKRADKEDDKETALIIAAAVGNQLNDNKKDDKQKAADDKAKDEKADPLKAAAKAGQASARGPIPIAGAAGGSSNGSGSGVPTVYDLAAHNDELFASESMLRALKIMERMVNQNAEAKIYHDYKYHESLHEAKNEENKRGTFYPLWPFASKLEEGVGRTVTCVVWNPEYTDLFAVGFGSYDFIHQKTGLICCYTLKNTTNPEYTFQLDSGVMCLDFHPQHSALLAVGMYDGTVCVFDVRNKSPKPIYVSSDPKVKHTDPVWQVRWSAEDIDQPKGAVAGAGGGKNLNFYSISSDGRVTNWILNKNELVNEELMTLKLVTKPEVGSAAAHNAQSNASHGGPAAAAAAAAAGSADSKDAPAGSGGGVAAGSTTAAGAAAVDSDATVDDQSDAALVGLAGGCCFDFNKLDDHLFVVGTEEGAIHKYTKQYSNSQYLQSFDGHHMAVYTVRWNPFHPGVFLSCSADWTVKIWEYGTPNPLLTYEFETSVGDVAWAPFSATTFACVTNDGKLRLYDLSVDKHEPIGEDYVHIDKKKDRPIKPTHLAFNPREPILAVGDESGVVSILKLSGNLRRSTAPNGNVDLLDADRESDRLDACLIIQNPDGSVTRMMDRKRPPRQIKLTAKQKAAAAAAAAALAAAEKKAAADSKDGKNAGAGGDGDDSGSGSVGASGTAPASNGPPSARGQTPRAGGSAADGNDSDDEKRSQASSAAPYLDRSASKLGQRKGAVTPLKGGFGGASPTPTSASGTGKRPTTPGGARMGSQAF